MLDRTLILTVNGADKWIRAHRPAAWTIWSALLVVCLYVRWKQGV